MVALTSKYSIIEFNTLLLYGEGYDEIMIENWVANIDFGKVRRRCRNLNGTCDAKDCGFQILNDDEIVTYFQKESDPVDDETDEDEDNNNNENSNASIADAFSALETAMEWYEQQSVCCTFQLLRLKRVTDLAAKERRCTMVQRNVSDYFPK
ncbi:uncharacterized protein TNCV_4490891 [Trichonephila clavipes]|nr:uncharacterized protein TNCV_4490891 [Trichonephila clavipes]